MSYSFTGKKPLAKSVATAFLPARVFVPLCQEKGVLCESVVTDGARVEEGQVIAEPSQDSFYGAKIHSPIPGRVLGMKRCTFPNGKCGAALEIALSGEFSHIGKKSQEIDWKTFGKNSLLNRIGAHGVVNTFSLREPTSLAGDIHEIMEIHRPRDWHALSGTKIFIRLYDEDPSCQTDRVLADSQFDKMVSAVRILCEIISPKEVVFVYAKNDDALIERLFRLKDEDDERFRFVAMNDKKFPCGTKHDILERYMKNMRLSDSEREARAESLFVDCETLSTLYDAVVYNIPVTRVNVSVSGDCLKSSAVLKVCVGTSFKSIAEELGLATENIGKIIVNGRRNGFAVPSLDAPVAKYVKSVEFVSHHDTADFSVAYCTGCGKCRESCPAQICPDMALSQVAGVEVPSEFVRAAALCVECGLCNCVCPVKLPLFQSVKILKEMQNGNE